jgi:flagellar biosynthesis protein FlhF
MIIKKYVGKTESDAVEQAQKELGNNIVVMNTKNVKRNGLMRFF